MTTFINSVEDLEQWPALKQFLGTTEGFPFRFVGLDIQMSIPLAVQVPTAPVPDVVEIMYVKDQTPREGTAAVMEGHSGRPGNNFRRPPAASERILREAPLLRRRSHCYPAFRVRWRTSLRRRTWKSHRPFQWKLRHKRILLLTL